MTFPILSKRIVIVIENFIKSDSLSEVTTFQQDEMNLILDQLRELTLEPSVYSQTVFKMAFPLSSPITHYTGKKFHLFKFFPLLSQCVLVKDSSIKSKLKLLFDEITLQLQL